MTYLMFIHDLDETDNVHVKESAMLDLPYQSIFTAEEDHNLEYVGGTEWLSRK